MGRVRPLGASGTRKLKIKITCGDEKTYRKGMAVTFFHAGSKNFYWKGQLIEKEKNRGAGEEKRKVVSTCKSHSSTKRGEGQPYAAHKNLGEKALSGGNCNMCNFQGSFSLAKNWRLNTPRPKREPSRKGAS